MPTISDQAIVLRRLDYSESSLVLVFFTRWHGKVRAIAKGVRRSTKTRFNPGIDLLECGQVTVSVRQVRQEALAILSDWRPGRAFTGLRERMDRWHAAQYAADVLGQLTDDWDPHAELFSAMEECLGALSDCSEALPPLVGFQRTALKETGLLPRLDACVGCGRPLRQRETLYFSSFDGGLICRDCEPAQVEKRLVRVSMEGLVDAAPATGADIDGLFDVFDYHLSHVMGRAPASREYLAGLVSGRLGGGPAGKRGRVR